MELEPQSFRVNRDLFSNYYLDEHLPETEEWDQVDEEALSEARQEILGLWNQERDTVEKTNESQLERRFIRPMFDRLGIPFEVEESVSRTQRRPDYGFFVTDEAARNAFERREEGGDFYENAVAVADAKRWDRPLDTRGSGEHQRDFENPSYQIHVYLQETPVRWAVLTNGKKWRLYYGPTSHRLDSYYEIDLPTILEEGDLADFKYFYLFFRHDAFVEDARGDAFLDDVYDESNVFARELGEDLQDNIYDAIKVLSEGFLQYPENDLTEDDLKLIHDSSLIYLYRLIFVLYAEAEGRDLLDTDNEIYEASYSLNALKQEIAEERDSADSKYRDWQTNLWSRLDELFRLIDQGSKSRGIPEDDLHIPAYNGGLFRTSPDEDDSSEARFLDEHEVGDAYLAEVIDLLARSRNGNGGGKIFVDYSSLDVRHLGSIYEGLLEYQLNVADEPLALDDGEYVPADEGDTVVVEAGDIYLTTGGGERKATGSYYTPEYVVEYIVDNTLGPLVDDIRNDLAGQDAYDDGGFAAEFADRVFEVKVLDPAMGSGHFLTSAVDYLAREIIDAQEKQAAQEGIETVEEEHDINWARRQVAQRCIYGVDLNPLAVELAKVSLWLRTLAAEQPLAFLDHHLKTGNSLVGSDIEEVLDNGDPDGRTADGQLTLYQSFSRTRRQALDHVTDRFQDLLAIDNETLDEIKEMETVFEEVRDDPLYQRLLAMADVHTADAFGLDIPGDAYERMAEALRDDSWKEVEGQDWFTSAQARAAEERYFHWELEFPVAFYGKEGDREQDAGFDAVIGNPPYVRVGGYLEQYLRDVYESPEYFVDLFHVFIEKGIELTNKGGGFGYIVPEPWLTMENTEKLRTYVLSNSSIEEITRFERKVFEDATVDTIILSLKKTDPSGDLSVKKAVNRRGGIEQINEVNTIDQAELLETSLKRIEVRQSKLETELLEKIRENGIKLDDVADISIGIQAYNRSKHTKEQIEKRVFHSDHKKSADYLPELSGQDVSRYHVAHDGDSWVKYGDHLHDYRPMRYFSEPRILVREITDDSNHMIHAAFTDEVYCNYKTILNILPSGEYDPHYVLSILNSEPMSWLFLRTSNKVVSDTFPRISVSDLEELVIPRIDFEFEGPYNRHELMELYNQFLTSGDEKPILKAIQKSCQSGSNTPAAIHDLLVELSENMADWTNKTKSNNLNLIEYFGNYREGPNLSDVGLFQPTGINTLDETKENYDSLRIGSVKIERADSAVTLYATARYKPENEDHHETDQWGYTETNYLEAFTLTDLTENEATLIEEFIPVAVEEASGFANFRETATKTNSLIDRLKAITLPDPDDVQDDLRRYIEVKTRGEELDEKIERTDKLIDKIVYELYGLTDEEIEIVKAAVQSD